MCYQRWSLPIVDNVVRSLALRHLKCADQRVAWSPLTMVASRVNSSEMIKHDQNWKSFCLQMCCYRPTVLVPLLFSVKQQHYYPVLRYYLKHWKPTLDTLHFSRNRQWSDSSNPLLMQHWVSAQMLSWKLLLEPNFTLATFFLRQNRTRMAGMFYLPFLPFFVSFNATMFLHKEKQTACRIIIQGFQMALQHIFIRAFRVWIDRWF
jgi:hypothetical protein